MGKLGFLFKTAASRFYVRIFYGLSFYFLIDAFLPRVVELATTSSDRQTKVAACELLHSLVLYMLGRSTMQPGGRQVTAPMTPLYKKVFPALMQLACDVEQV